MLKGTVRRVYAAISMDDLIRRGGNEAGVRLRVTLVDNDARERGKSTIIEDTANQTLW